jgi:hypothetical protein
MKYLISSLIIFISSIWLGAWMWYTQAGYWWFIPAVASIGLAIAAGFVLFIVGIWDIL